MPTRQSEGEHLKKYLSIICLLLVIMSVGLLRKEDFLGDREYVSEVTTDQFTVVLDAGHGGFDPGKVGINGVLEKDINLSITMKVKALLEEKGCKVYVTRDADVGLYPAGATNKKSADMRKRVELITEQKPDIAVSIHQNSFPQENCKGAQVFYYVNSVEGKKLAEIIQEQLKVILADGNKRVAKSNDTYYMLKKSNCPLVIVECGFLSNSQEAQLLTENEYQDKVADAIHNGIMQYLEKNRNK